MHEQGFTATREGDDLVFRDPTGGVLPTTGSRPHIEGDSTAALHQHLGPAGRAITPDTNQPGWDGWPVNYDLCVAALASPSTGPA